MEDRVFNILEWDKVCARLAAHAQTVLGKARLTGLAPCATREQAEAELGKVEEAVRFRQRIGDLPWSGVSDIHRLLRKAQAGGVLGPGELNQLVAFIVAGRRIRQTLTEIPPDIKVPGLHQVAEQLFDARQTEVEIRQAIAEDDSVLDQASPELRQIRQQRRQFEGRIRDRLEAMLRTHQRFLQDPVITVRGDSLCLPVRVEFKQQIPGVIHDVSASGATVFVEPQEVVSLHARVRALVMEEERAVERVLQRLSGVVAAVADGLASNACWLGQLDAWFAKAAYALSEDAQMPRLRSDGVWSLRRARHPLIPRDQAVPMDLSLGQPFTLVVITGPNTGGKTVALKTLGLLTLMAMSGCFIPASEGSELSWCDGVYADIGDEQSIEQSLSTFSAHMRNIVGMLHKVSAHSLVLLDELGAGTDPAEGAALAVALLEYFKERGVRVVATTHYAELKAYAFHEPLATNASVEFDIETLRPTYRLRVGVPGRSNALAIAARLGVPEAILARARAELRSDNVRVEELIAKIEIAQRQAEQLRAEAERERQALVEERARLALERAQWEASRQQEEADAVRRAQEVLERAEREAERVIQELRSRQRQAVVKDHELVALRKALDEARPNLQTGQRRRIGPADIPVGATVRVLSFGQKGEVVERSADGRELVVQLGPLRMKLPVQDVELVSGAQRTAEQAVTRVRRNPAAHVPLQLDVRGHTVDEAIPQVDKYLDAAVVHGLKRVTIIHGKGTGALRDGLRRFLSRHPHVAAWAPGGPGEGGDGATVCDLQ
ncbi:MAG: endonuclease MutS2 [Alicyclobacillus sp.]|nr:endonuclease MutS2 [Alicyclobacillus sp.]